MSSLCTDMHRSINVVEAKQLPKLQLGPTIVALAALGAAQFFVGCATAAQPAEHPMQTLESTQWGDAPPIVPPGAKIAVLDGNPGAEVPYTVKLKFPAHYKIPPHSHPKDEHVTILQGKLFFGMGETFDTARGKPLSVGGFTTMTTGMNHYAYTENDEVVILLHGIGPIDFKYVNPADDPRNK
jgi:quercetin dioxygenase-like cupin family protein